MLTGTYGNKLAYLATIGVSTGDLDRRFGKVTDAVLAHIEDVDGTGHAALVSRMVGTGRFQAHIMYEGFALALQHDTDSQKFGWVQFIARQLILDDHSFGTGNVVSEPGTVAYSLLETAEEIKDYTSPGTSSNWGTC